MKTTLKNKLACISLALGLCVANAAIVLAQPVEIDVTGGGFTIRGPSTLMFAPQPFSLTDEISVVNFKDVQGSSTLQYLEISDQTGGHAFNVALGAEDLTPGGSGICSPNKCIPKDHLLIRNNDGSTQGDSGSGITTVNGQLSYVSLDGSTNFSNTTATLDQQRVLLNGTGSGPGTWRIYPQLQETTPGNTAQGNYSGNIIITIMTT